MVKQNQSLIEQKKILEESYAELDSSYESSVSALSNAIDARDPYTAGHSQCVAKMALFIGEKMGLTPERLSMLKLAALFHDIGKIGIPDSILKSQAN